MISLKNVSLWKNSVEAISYFISEGNFRFSDTGVKFRAIDPSQIVLVNYEIDKKAFDTYEIEPNLVGVNIVELAKVMNRSFPDDSFSMSLTESELLVKLEGDLIRSFRLPLVDISEDEINLPKHQHDVVVEVNARKLKEALKDAALFSSTVFLRIKQGKFFVEASGSAGKLKTEIKKAKVTGKDKTDILSKYSLNFLTNMVKDASPEETIDLSLKSDSPIKLSYNIGESKIEFYLAHMII